MIHRVELSAAAAHQLREAIGWWRAHREAAPGLLEQELAVALDIAGRAPLLSPVIGELDGVAIRRVQLPRSRYAIYFTVGTGIVTVHALWHGSRGDPPPDP